MPSERIEKARKDTQLMGGGNLGYVGRLEAMVIGLEKEVDALKTTGNKIAQMLAILSTDIRHGEALSEWQEVSRDA